MLDFIEKSAKNLREIKTESKNHVLYEILFKYEGISICSYSIRINKVRNVSVSIILKVVT